MNRQGELIDLGFQPDYGKVLDLQRKLVSGRIEGRIPDTLLLVEHNHVLTVGRRGTRGNIRVWSMPVYHVERGGDVTYHGPGQLVGYPILKLKDWARDVKNHVRNLERVLLRTLKGFGLEAHTVEGNTGVWVGEKKIASIGVAVKRQVTYHGFALNVNTDLERFRAINPCGFPPDLMTSMNELLGREVPLDKVKTNLVDQFSEVFHIDLKMVDREDWIGLK